MTTPIRDRRENNVKFTRYRTSENFDMLTVQTYLILDEKSIADSIIELKSTPDWNFEFAIKCQIVHGFESSLEENPLFNDKTGHHMTWIWLQQRKCMILPKENSIDHNIAT
jgi:hypothetical protein